MVSLSRAALLALVALALAQPVNAQSFNGADSWAPANGYDAPIFRQFAFVEGRVTQYHVLKPNIFRTDDHMTNIYQFPQCPDLQPVLQYHAADHDAPTRQIVDVTLRSGCSIQPTTEAEAFSLAGVGLATGIGTDAVGAVVPRNLYVNAPKIPAALEDLTDLQLYNGPPYRPRIDAWEEGKQVRFITYEASWLPSWLGTNFPAQDADVFIISYGPIFREGWSILNVAAGTPHDPETFRAYSPIWRANCIVAEDDPVCGTSVHQPDFQQCFSVAQCTTMPGVTVIQPPDFTHINCPMVAVDITKDMYVAEFEELPFPDHWKDGPVLV